MTLRGAPSSILLPIALSILLHALLMLVIRPGALSLRSPLEAREKDFLVRVLPQDDPRGQIVDLEDGPTSERSPNDAKYLSDKNRIVDRETQARDTGLLRGGPAGRPGAAKPRGSGELNLSLPEKFLDRFNGAQGESSPGAQAPTNHLPGVDYGIDTQLNTREYKFASYFIRVKRQIEAVWSPRSVIQTQNLSQRTYTTTLDVILNRQGYVESVELARSSGNALLDQEAIRAVRSAGPYLNPPEEMIENGKVYIEDFRFIVSLNRFF